MGTHTDSYTHKNYTKHYFSILSYVIELTWLLEKSFRKHPETALWRCKTKKTKKFHYYIAFSVEPIMSLMETIMYWDTYAVFYYFFD